jgi:hypothetical protein
VSTVGRPDAGDIHDVGTSGSSCNVAIGEWPGIVYRFPTTPTSAQSRHIYRLVVHALWHTVKLRSYVHCLQFLKRVRKHSSLALSLKSLIMQPLYWYSDYHLDTTKPPADQVQKELQVFSELDILVAEGRLENLETFVWEGWAAPALDRVWETLRSKCVPMFLPVSLSPFLTRTRTSRCRRLKNIGSVFHSPTYQTLQLLCPDTKVTCHSIVNWHRVYALPSVILIHRP